MTQYDRHKCEGGLFVDYINTLLKLKAEASGYPSWIRSHEDEERYIENFYAREGVRLDSEAIRPIAAKRGLAKLFFNSLWGNLTERGDRTHAKLISDPNELYRFLATPGVEVANLLFASDSVVWTSWPYTAEEQVPSLRHTEVARAFGGRMQLYACVLRLGERALYCDTDSVIFVQKDGEPPLIECGYALGDMTSEMKGIEYISEFVSGGPKIYAYKLCYSVMGEKKAVCKVRRITLKYKASQLVNFETIKDMALNGAPPVTVHTDKNQS